MKCRDRSFSLRCSASHRLLLRAAPALLALAVCCEPETRPLNDFDVAGRSNSETFATGGSSGGSINAMTALGGASTFGGAPATDGGTPGLGGSPSLGGAAQKAGGGLPGAGGMSAIASDAGAPNNDGSLMAGAAGDAGAGGANGPSEPAECGSDSMCQDARRPFCDALHRCVACKQDFDCPSSSRECFSARCVLGECQEVPAAAGASCGSASATECDAADTCDGAGRCRANFNGQGTPCADDGLFCNGAEECDGAGQCGHVRAPCPASLVCHEVTKSCSCDPAIVAAMYCGVPDEAMDRAAVQEAQSVCHGCGDGTFTYERVSRDGCTEFYCVP